jgi:uncharacterized protein (DUF849 family)
MKRERDIPKPQPASEPALPATVEEYQQALRQAFVAGAQFEYARWRTDRRQHSVIAEEEARRRYPIRKQVPRTVSLAGGVLVRWDEGHLRFLNPRNGDPYLLTCIGSASLDALRDILANPFDEVEE